MTEADPAQSSPPPPVVIDFAADMGKDPLTIVPVLSKNDLVSYSNLFFHGTSTDHLTQALLSDHQHPAPTGTTRSSSTEQLTAHREQSSGAWTFKPNTERDLLAHVQNGLSDYITNFSDVDSARAILRSIDVYCLGKQWMYHVGREKGTEVIEPFLGRCLEQRKAQATAQTMAQAASASDADDRFVIVELGTYCGYSAILLAMTVRQLNPDLDFIVYSTEINAQNLEVAAEMIRMAKLEEYVTLILLDDHEVEGSLSNALAEHIPTATSQKKKIDFLFLDHAKECYLRDLHGLENSELVGKGTYVLADNVVFSGEQLQTYMDYIASLKDKSVVESTTVEGKLEYSSCLKDGMELTIYLQDPPKNS